MGGKESILGTNGPLCTSREDLELFMSTVMNSEPWRMDPAIFPKKWTPHKFTKPLKVAIQWSDGIVKPHPPVLRALAETAKACKDSGMEVVDWVSLDHAKGWEIASGLYFPDGGKDVYDTMAESGEPVLPLTKWVLEQPNVKARSMKEFWNVSTSFINDEELADMIF